MAIQIESAVKCRECQGEKGTEVSRCPMDCWSSRTPEGCHHERAYWIDCEACKGTGVEECQACGDPAELLESSGDAFCIPCSLAFDAERPGAVADEDEEGGDSPMGGMGYQHDYAPALEAARALK